MKKSLLERKKLDSRLRGNDRWFLLISSLFFFSLPLFGCNAFLEEIGGEGQPCSKKYTCREDLICKDGICVNPNSSNGDEEEGDNNQSGGDEEMLKEQEDNSGNPNVIPLEDMKIGAPCEEDTDCNKEDCLTTERARTMFALEGDAEFEIPGGYCTSNFCQPLFYDGSLCPVSEGAYCLSIEPIYGIPNIGLCLRLCNTGEDCAPYGDQVCVGADEFGFTEEEIQTYYADAGKVCLPSDMYDSVAEEVEYMHTLEEK